MRRPLSLLVVLSAFVLSSCQGSQVRDVRPNQEEEQPRTSIPVDVLGLQVNQNVAMMFGLRLFNDIHTKMEQCRVERNSIDSKYSNQTKRLQQYYDEAERVILKSRSQFEKLVHENSEDIEANFQKAFRGLEKSRDKKLKRLESKCASVMKSFLDARLQDAMMFAETLIAQDPVEFTKLTFDVSTYATQLRGVLSGCVRANRPHLPPPEQPVDPDSHGQMNFDICYVHEIQKIISFVDHFLAQADELRQRYYGDDEDFYDVVDENNVDVSGDYQDDGYEQETKMPTAPTRAPPSATSPRSAVSEGLNIPINGLFEPGPVIFGKPEQSYDEKDNPTSAGGTPSSMPTTEPAASIPIDDLLEPGLVIIKPHENETPLRGTKEVPTSVTSGSKRDEKKMDEFDDDVKEPTEPFIAKDSTTNSKPTHGDPDWLDEAFDDIIGPEEDAESEEETDEPGEFDENDLKTPARSRSKSEGEEEELHHRGDMDLSLPGVDLEIGAGGVNFEANIGQEGSDQSLNVGGSIIFEDDAKYTTPESSEDDGNSFISYTLIYFFVTLGTLLLLTILVLSITIIMLRMRVGRTPKDTPLLSEEEKIAVMKQTGYVNPTYKFLDSNVKDV